jgi:outer membrane protein TolC
MSQMNAGQGNTSATQSSMQLGAMSPSSGNTGLSDIYRIEIEAGDLENNIGLLKNQKRTVMAQFNSFLNRPLLSPVFIPERLTPDSLAITQVALLDSLQANNPMLGMIGYEKQSVEARKKMISRMGLPMVGIGLNYSLINKSDLAMGEPSMNGNDMIMPMVSLTLPVYRKKYNAMKSEASFLESAADYNYQSTVNDLQTEYYQSLQAYEDARRRIKLYDDQLVLAEKTLDIILKSYSASTSDLAEVLRARQQTYDYELKQAEALTDFNTAVAWMRRLGGLKGK